MRIVAARSPIPFPDVRVAVRRRQDFDEALRPFHDPNVFKSLQIAQLSHGLSKWTLKIAPFLFTTPKIRNLFI